MGQEGVILLIGKDAGSIIPVYYHLPAYCFPPSVNGVYISTFSCKLPLLSYELAPCQANLSYTVGQKQVIGHYFLLEVSLSSFSSSSNRGIISVKQLKCILVSFCMTSLIVSYSNKYLQKKGRKTGRRGKRKETT